MPVQRPIIIRPGASSRKAAARRANTRFAGRLTPRSEGFTLVEITVTLVIIAVLSAVAIPRFGRSVARYRVEHAARRLQADLILARDKAIHQSRAFTVAFVTGATSSYTVIGLRDLNHGSLPDYRVNLYQEPYRASIVSVSAGGDASIVFDGYGMPDSAGAIRVSVGALSRTVLVDANTGEVQVSTP